MPEDHFKMSAFQVSINIVRISQPHIGDLHHVAHGRNRPHHYLLGLPVHQDQDRVNLSFFMVDGILSGLKLRKQSRALHYFQSEIICFKIYLSVKMFNRKDTNKNNALKY